VIAVILTLEPPLTQYAPDVPAEWQPTISQPRRKEKEERYQTSQELLRELKSLKQELEIQARLERSKSPDVGGQTRAESGADQDN
jgi:hypothetical protein